MENIKNVIAYCRGGNSEMSQVAHLAEEELEELQEAKTQTDEIGQVEAVVSFVKILKSTIDNAYHIRKDYPPLALMAWDDRNRYRKYIFEIMDEILSKQS